MAEDIVSLGHNKPPDMTITAAEMTAAINTWLGDNPVIATEEQAREAKPLLDRAKRAHADLEAERTSITKPLRDHIDNIMEYYRGPRTILEKITDVLKEKLADYIAAEEAQRIKAAEEARAKAEALEREAREAEAKEQEVIENSDLGEVGVDIVGATLEADQKFKEYAKAEHQAIIAERASKVRVGGGFARAASLWDKVVPSVVDPMVVVATIGWTPEIIAAVLKSAKAWKRLTGEWPPGVEVTVTRKL